MSSTKMTKTQLQEDERLKRLSKRLLYVMRYGAVKEGLHVDDNGYVDISEAQQVPLLSTYTQDELMNEVMTSISYRNTHRYEWKEKDNKMFVRASYLRRFEPSPYHQGTKVKTLSETSMTCVLDNLDLFDLEDFQDEYTIKLMIRRLKRKKTLSNKSLAVLLVPTLTRIDLEGIYLTNNTLRLLWTQCPHLRGISLKDCGYIVTDTILTQLVKNLPKLDHLNLSRCSHLTDKCLAILSKRLPHIKVLRVAGVPAITPKSVHTFMEAAKDLTCLDVFYMKTSQDEYDWLMRCAKKHEVELVLHSPREKLPEYKKHDYEEEEEEEEVEGEERYFSDDNDDDDDSYDHSGDDNVDDQYNDDDFEIPL